MLRLPPGGTLSLQCTISRLNLPPKNLHWKHEKEILTSQTRPGVSLEFEKLSGESHTKLVIVDLKSSDEGTYQCATDVSRPASVQVFIGKKTELVYTVTILQKFYLLKRYVYIYIYIDLQYGILFFILKHLFIFIIDVNSFLVLF